MTAAALDEARLARAWADNAVTAIKVCECPYTWAGANAEAIGRVSRHTSTGFEDIKAAIAARAEELGIYPPNMGGTGV